MSEFTPSENQIKMKSGVKREFYIKIAIEVSSVVLAVLLALGVDEWRENRKNEKLAKQAEYNIKKEIKVNIKRLEYISANYRKDIIIVDSLLNVCQNSKGEISLPVNNFTLISNTVWETVKSTKTINHIELNTVLFYSTFYQLFDIYNQEKNLYLYKKSDKKDKYPIHEAIDKLQEHKKMYQHLNRTSKQIIDFYEVYKEQLQIEENGDIVIE